MTCVAHVDNEGWNACCLWVPNTRGSTVPLSVIKTQWTVCEGDPVLESNGFISQGSGVIYRTGIQALLIQQMLQVYTDTSWPVGLTQA